VWANVSWPALWHRKLAATDRRYTCGVALFSDLAIWRADGSLRNLLARLSQIDVLLIDDWVMAPLHEQERRDLWEICEDRCQMRSTILTSQLPVAR
jgi:DNA replication protein DnaC